MVNLYAELRDSSRAQSIPSEIVSQLRQIPWCNKYLDDPAWIPLTSYSRDRPPAVVAVGRRSWMGVTLQTEDTLSVWQAFYRPSISKDVAGDVHVVIVMGTGMDGHLNTAHGGLAATLLDETMGTIAGIHRTRGKSVYTAYLHVNYKKPLPTPGPALITSKLDLSRSGGRKIFITGSLESGDGTVYNTADGLFLEVDREVKSRL